MSNMAGYFKNNLTLAKFTSKLKITIGIKPLLNDHTFSSNTVFVTQTVRWLNGQTMFDQTLDNERPFKCKVERGG